ncbi:MAG: triose-phosphate isomerase [Patescibacteria group bacterium]
MSERKIKPKHNSVVVANWKMNTLIKESSELTSAINKGLSGKSGPEVIICPPYTSLLAVSEIIKNGSIRLGALDVFWEENGNYTGEISVPMLMEIGVSHVVIGHSERRQHVGETDEMIDRKVTAVLRHQLTPIICVGETADQRRRGVEFTVIAEQVKLALRYKPPPPRDQKIIVCYEPVWSIWPGQPCDPNQAKEAANVVRQSLVDLYPPAVVEDNFQIIYGGSVDPNNVQDYIDQEVINGVLVGTASRKSESFLEIIKNTPHI